MANESRHPGADRTASAEKAPQRGAMRLAAPPALTSGDVRDRLASAWAESISVRGYNRTTVQHIVELSGISRSTFYEYFGCKDDAFVAIHADALVLLTARLDIAMDAESDWSHGVAAALASALKGAASRPREAQLLVGDPFAAGPRMGYCHDLLIARFAPGLAAGRKSTHALPPPPSLETGLIGSLIGVISSRVRSGSAHTLPALGPSLTEFVLAPYIGAEEAKRVAYASSLEALQPGRTDMAETDVLGDDFAAAFEDAFSRLRIQIETACADEREWPVRIAVGIRAAFAFAADHPDAARLLTNEALARGEKSQVQYQRMISYFAALLLSARDPGSDDGHQSTVAENAMAGGVALLVGRRLAHDREDELPAAASEAAQFVLTPWVGIDQARQIANEHC